MTEAISGYSGYRPSLPARLLEWRRRWLAIDKNERAVQFAMTPVGMMVMHVALFAALLVCQIPKSIVAVTMIFLPLIAVFPSRKLFVIGLSTAAFLLLQPFKTEGSIALPQFLIDHYGQTWLHPRVLAGATAMVFMAAAYAVLAMQARQVQSAFSRRPVVTLLIAFWAMVSLGLMDVLPPAGQVILWMLIALFGSMFWYLAYALVDQRSKDQTPRLQRLGLFRPMWCASITPVGKGANYLNKFEAKNKPALAAVRLRAVKLAVWAVILFGVERATSFVVHDVLAVAMLEDALATSVSGGPPPLWMGWMVVVNHYLLNIVSFCVFGHLTVATIRMAGYGIPRNSARPLASRTLAEFWNRYYYYFKELLVDFFFYPAFLRWFKQQPRLRIAFATFTAAAVGNFLYHFMREIDLVARDGLWSALQAFESYAVYCLLLAAGLIVSQLRNKRPKPQDGFLRYDVLPRLTVGLFFCLLAVFGDSSRVGTLGERFEFLTSLFGV